MHSRMLQDVKQNADALVTEIKPEVIRADLEKLKDLKVPAAEIYIPKTEDIHYTIGNQWKQRYPGGEKTACSILLRSSTTSIPIAG